MTAGAILGLAYVLQMVAGYLLRDVMGGFMGTVLNLLGFGAIVAVLLFFGRRSAGIRDVEGAGYSYGAAFGFSLLVLMLAGVMVGVCQWVLQNVVDPVYYNAIYQKSLESMIAVGKMSDDQQQIMRQSAQIMRSVWGMIGASLLSMLLQGGLVALLTAAYVKRPAQRP